MKGFFSKIGSFFSAMTKFMVIIPPFLKRKLLAFLHKRPSLERIYNLTGLQLANSSRYKAPTTLWKKIIVIIFQFALFFGLIFLFVGVITLFDEYIFGPTSVTFDKAYVSFVLSVYIFSQKKNYGFNYFRLWVVIFAKLFAKMQLNTPTKSATKIQFFSGKIKTKCAKFAAGVSVIPVVQVVDAFLFYK